MSDTFLLGPGESHNPGSRNHTFRDRPPAASRDRRRKSPPTRGGGFKQRSSVAPPSTGKLYQTGVWSGEAPAQESVETYLPDILKVLLIRPEYCKPSRRQAPRRRSARGGVSEASGPSLGPKWPASPHKRQYFHHVFGQRRNVMVVERMSRNTQRCRPCNNRTCVRPFAHVTDQVGLKLGNRGPEFGSIICVT